ncbi:hypothetical protein HGE68_09050 [Rhodobacteraceae bacterium R_SAG6]|nr:hypothetical protein [Rhodobacteraceae bacterium R_SAG6]
MRSLLQIHEAYDIEAKKYQSSMIRIFKTGKHSQRTPLSYSALQTLFLNDLELVNAPKEADVYVFAHSLDIQDAPYDLVDDWHKRQRPIVLLSEEPFWDTIWTKVPFACMHIIESKWGPLPVHQVTHQTSTVFHFDHIPYYLLTNHRFANAYATRFHRNAALEPTDWVEKFHASENDVTFMFERRPESYHSVHWPEGDLFGLCAWRTELAESVSAGRIERLGHSWSSTTAARTTLYDWHIDKLVTLDGKTRLMAAFENTHQPQYITEKIFDAFACGALPAYVANPHHRLHDLDLPEASWINLFGMSPQRAAARLDQLDWKDSQFLEEVASDYTRAQRKLAAIFASPNIWYRERLRLRAALLAEFERILDASHKIPTPRSALCI